MEQKIKLDFQNDLKKKIEYNNIRAEAIKHIDTMNITRMIDDTINSLNNNSNINNQKVDENEGEEIKFDDLLNEVEKMMICF